MVTQIHPAQFADWLESVKDQGRPVLLDVREPYELRLASVKPMGLDFELLTIPMGVVPPRLHELDPRRPIACLCHHGARSMQVAYFLQARGFAEVANLAGGINAWASELDPTVPRY